MSIHRLSRIFYLASGVLLSLLAVFALLRFRGQLDLERTQDIRYASYLLADELRQSSDDLTRMARTYVITGDPTFERMYWETLAIRNGEVPRPRHYERIYWDRVLGEPGFQLDPEGVKVSLRTLMERLGFTPVEFAKLAEAENNSNELVQTELAAFNAMKGLFRDSTGQFTVTGAPDPEWARRILHDEHYHQAKAAIMKPVNDFYELLDTRTGDAVRVAEHRANLYLTAVLLLFGLILMLLALSYVIVRKALVAEEALRENEERYRMVSQVISDYAFSVHFEADGTLAYDWLTESFTKITGYEVAEVLDKPHLLQRYIHPEDLARINTTIRRLPPGVITSYEFRIICRDGSVRWLRSYAQPLFDAHGQLSRLYGATQDITEHKRAEEEKRKLHEQLFQAQKLEAIGTLAGGIAHDFNNILTIILGFSELLKKVVLADAVAQGNLEEVRKAGNRAKELVQQLLAFSRPEQQTRSPVDLHLVVAESLGWLRAVLPTTIEIRSSLDASGAVVLGNATQLHQVIMNLGVNALQAMQDTGGVLEVRVEPTMVTSALARIHPSLTPGSYCQLTVRDTGCGMTPEVMARIFDPFFTTKPAGEGSGLGLSVVHGIVSSYGGTVTVDSSPGQGAAFAVYLPQSTEAVASPAPVALPPRSKSGRVVLFVDDEKAVAQMARQMLEHLGYEAVVTTSSHEALDTFRHRPGHFDVVVTDQTMPGLTGDQLARELLALRPEVPIILCTGCSPMLTEEKARAVGVRTYLRKPLSTAELGRALEDIFTSREEN